MTTKPEPKPNPHNLPTYSDGTLRKYTDLGCYPVLYLDSRDNVLCAECAEESRSSEYTAEHPVVADVNYGDPHLHCDECSERIESAYAEDDEDEETTDDV